MLTLLLLFLISLMPALWFLGLRCGRQRGMAFRLIVLASGCILLGLPVWIFFGLGFSGPYAIFLAAPSFAIIVLTSTVAVALDRVGKTSKALARTLVLFLLALAASYFGAALYQQHETAAPVLTPADFKPSRKQ